MSRFGWIPQFPDCRDKTLPTGFIAYTNNPGADLRKTGWFSPVEDQGNLGSCTAQAVVGVLEYTEKRARGVYLDHSRLFLYRASRKLYFRAPHGKVIGDTGCTIRETFKALMAFGCPPEWIWPYDISKYDQEPPPDAYALAQAYQGLYYVSAKSLAEIQGLLRHDIPVCFGFSCYDSINDVGSDGRVPIPAPGERLAGGHAVVAVGYTSDEIIFRNSWGRNWGEAGYGYLPFWYFEQNQTSDYWALLRSEWVD